MASGARKALEMRFGIGGKLNSSFGQATAGAGKQLDVLSEKARKVSRATKMGDLKTAYKGLNKAAWGVSKAWGGLAKEISTTAKQAALAVTGITAAIYGVATVSGLAGDKMAKTAAKIGISTQAFSELTWAASLAGVSQDSLAGAMTKLNKNLGAAAQGGKEAQLAFRRLGVDIKDSSGKLKSADQVLMEAAATFEKMPEGPYKASLAMAVFGKSGADLIPLLQQGTKAIEGQRAEAELLNIAWNEAAGENAAKFMDSMNRLKQVSIGLTNTFGKELHPILTSLNDDIVDLWIANKDLISTKVAAFVEDFKAYLPELKENIKGAAIWIKDMAIRVNEIVHFFGGWETVITRLVQAWAVWRGIMLATKFAGLVGGALKFVGALVKLNDAMKATGSIKALSSLTGFGAAVSNAKAGVLLLTGALKGATIGALKFAAALLVNPITWIVVGIAAAVAAIVLLYKNWDKVSGFIKEKWQVVCNWVGEKWEAVSGWLVGKWKSITAAFDQGVIQGIWNLIKTFNPISLFLNIVNGMVKAIFGIDLLATGKAWIGKFLDGIMGAIKGAAGIVKDAVLDLLPDMPDWLGGGNKAVDPVARSAGHYAKGGMVSRPELAWLGEKGPEMVIPMDGSKRASNLLSTAAKGMGGLNPPVSAVGGSTGRLGPIETPGPRRAEALGQAITQSTSNTFGAANFNITVNMPINNNGNGGGGS